MEESMEEVEKVPERKEIVLEIDEEGRYSNVPLTAWTVIRDQKKEKNTEFFHLMIPFTVEQKGRAVVVKGWKRVGSRVDEKPNGEHTHIDIFEKVEMDLRYVTLEGEKSEKRD